MYFDKVDAILKKGFRNIAIMKKLSFLSNKIILGGILFLNFVFLISEIIFCFTIGAESMKAEMKIFEKIKIFLFHFSGISIWGAGFLIGVKLKGKKALKKIKWIIFLFLILLIFSFSFVPHFSEKWDFLMMKYDIEIGSLINNLILLLLGLLLGERILLYFKDKKTISLK